MEGKQAFQLTSVILHNSDSLIMGTKWVCGVLRQWLWSNPPPKKTKPKNPQMEPFQTHVWTPTQQWFNVWRCCILLSHPPLVIPLQYQVWLKVSQKLRLWGWQRGFQLGVKKDWKDDSNRRPPLDTNFLAISERDAQDGSTALTFFFWERMKKKHSNNCFHLRILFCSTTQQLDQIFSPFFSEQLSICVKDREQVTVSWIFCEYRSALPLPPKKHSQFWIVQWLSILA